MTGTTKPAVDAEGAHRFASTPKLHPGDRVAVVSPSAGARRRSRASTNSVYAGSATNSVWFPSSTRPPALRTPPRPNARRT